MHVHVYVCVRLHSRVQAHACERFCVYVQVHAIVCACVPMPVCSSWCARELEGLWGVRSHAWRATHLGQC